MAIHPLQNRVLLLLLLGAPKEVFIGCPAHVAVVLTACIPFIRLLYITSSPSAATVYLEESSCWSLADDTERDYDCLEIVD